MGDAESVCVWWGHGGRQGGAQLCQETSVQSAALDLFCFGVKKKKKKIHFPSLCLLPAQLVIDPDSLHM